MENQENIFEKIQAILGNVNVNFSILEHQVDVRDQMEYFDFSRNLRRDFDPEFVLNREQELYDDEVALESRRELLVSLASIDKPEAYRIIERFVKVAPNELKDWAILSLQESRLLLESKLLEENQVFISTGLGGLRGKLRYFIALFSESNSNFSDIQRNLIKGEFDYIFPKFQAEVEKVDFFANYATIVALIPLNIPVKDPIKSAIDECNNLGNFIKQGFLITNVKILTSIEIESLVNNTPPEDLLLKE
ncbi:MAG: hypothetical protein HXX16_11795 [Bacteroidales bacterium]|nr:hypothetical protein [Bacteroidales bacterium]